MGTWRSAHTAKPYGSVAYIEGGDLRWRWSVQAKQLKRMDCEDVSLKASGRFSQPCLLHCSALYSRVVH